MHFRTIPFLSEEDGGDGHSSDDAAEVGEEACCDSVAGLADTDRAEIDGEDVEGGVGCALEDAGEAAYEGVCPVLLHGIYHHTARSAAGERLHNGRWQGCHIVGIAAAELNKPPYAIHDEVHRSRSTEHADGNKYRNEIRDDADGCFEASFRPFDKCLIDIYLLANTCRNEGDDDGEEDDVGYDSAPEVHRLTVNLCAEPYHAAHHNADAKDKGHDSAVEEVDALVDAGDNHAAKCSDGCGDEDGAKDIRRLCCTICAL